MKKIFFSRIEYVGFILFSLFPILPNRLKGIPVIILFLISVVLFIKEREYKYPFKKVLFFSSLYLIYVISLIYTEHIGHVDKLLSTRLSLLVVPISFGFISTIKRRIEFRTITYVFKITILITTVYSSLVLFYLYQLGVFSGIMSLNDALAYITNGMWGINQHPIYASLFIGISIVLTSIILLEEKKRSTYIMMIIPLIIMISALLILSRKSILVALFITGCGLFILNKGKFRKYFLGIAVVFSLIIIVSPNIRGRFNELFKKSTYISIKEDNSTSIRYGIYTCVFDKIIDAPLLGYGIGDVRYELNECYEKRFDKLNKMNYNSHNQYLSYFLSCGILGFLLLIFIITKSISKAVRDKDLFLLSLSIFFGIIMLFENILERQSGVILFSFYLGLLNFIDFKRVTINNEN